MTRAEGSASTGVAAERELVYISLGGPKARDSSGRDDKGEGGASREVAAERELVYIFLGGSKAHDSSGRDDNGARWRCRKE
jgi:hypothetical protein